MEVTEIRIAFGAYYEKSGQNMKRIMGLLSQGLVLPGYCTPIKTDDTVYKLSQLAMSDLVQAFQKKFTPKNATAFKANELRLYHLKVDEELYPDDIEATWLGFLSSEGVDRKDWPLIKFLIEHADQGIIAKINENMELKEYGHGVFENPEDGEAGVTGKSMNGLIHQLTTGVADDTINSINIGALDKDAIFDQVEEFILKISQVYQNVKMNLFMSPYWALMYHRDKRGQGYYQIQSDADVKNSIDFSPIQVVSLPALNGSDAIFATPKNNLLHLTKKSANKTKIKVEEYRRNVSLLCDWWEGVGFGMNAAVWTNLQKESQGSGSGE
jgi:hypothetical protein